MACNLPWRFVVDGDEVIIDGRGIEIHRDATYYPSGLSTDDAKFIVESVNRCADMERMLPFIWRRLVNASDWAARRTNWEAIDDELKRAMAVVEALGRKVI